MTGLIGHDVLKGSAGSQQRMLITANDTCPVPGLWKSEATDAHSFHLSKLHGDLREQVDLFLHRDIGRKPRIISSDGADTLGPQQTTEILKRIPRDGSVAYEHFDQLWSSELKGGYIESDGKWPAHIQGSDWRAFEGRAKVLGDHASMLKIDGALGVRDGRWCWNDKPVHLIGMSVSYGLLSTTRHQLLPVLDFLQRHRINFLRVWVTEQWTSRVAKDYKGLPGSRTAMAPWPLERGQYQLHQRNPPWFRRLGQFLELAAARGIAVQVSLFDWCGLRNRKAEGYWKQSPFNPKNNSTELLTGHVPEGEWHQGFTQVRGSFWNQVIQPLIRDIALVVAKHPNAFLEIANEARAESMDDVLEWHEEVSGVIRKSAQAKS